MKQTKEQLSKLSNEFEIRLKQEVERDEFLRKEFAKAFGWWEKPRIAYGVIYNYKEPLCPTWEEIFVELGKLLAARNFYDLEGNVSELECRIDELENAGIKKNEKGN